MKTIYGNALIAAAVGNHRDIIKLLLDRGANVNATGPGNCTALQAASRYCPADVVKLLLEFEADVNVTRSDNGHGSALEAACARGNKDVVQMLLEWRADVNKLGGGPSPLSTASYSGHKEIDHLIQWNADVNLHLKWNCSALYKAVEGGHKDIVEILHRNKADVNVQGYDGSAF